jgi:hypothetical protein
MSNPKGRKILRITLMIVAILVVAAGCIAAYFASNYKSMIRQRLPGWIAKATDSVYQVSVDDISINIATRNVTITGIKLWPDTSQAGMLRMKDAGHKQSFTLDAPEVHIDGIGWEQLVAEKELKCSLLQISNANIVVTTRDADTTQRLEPKKKPKIEKIAFGDIALVNSNITYRTRKEGQHSDYYFKGGKVSLKNWIYDPEHPEQKSNFLYAKDFSLELDTISFKTADEIYSISTGKVQLKGSEKGGKIEHFRVQVLMSKDDFHQRIGHQQDIYDVHFPTIELKGADFSQMMHEGSFAIEDIVLNRSSVEIYHSRIPPPDPRSKMGNYPNQLIQKLKIPLYIGAVHISNGHFKYTEVSNVTRKAGSFHIEAMRGTVTNATNIPERLQKQTTCIADLKGMFMNKSNMAGKFTFSLTDTAGAFEVEGTHYALDAKQINDITRALASADISSLYISKLSFYVKGNENEGTANITMPYRDLKIAVLKPEDTTKNKPILTFLANNILLYDHNPMPDDTLRRATAYQKRNPKASFFNLIWKCVFEAAAKTAMKSENIANELAEKKPNDKKKGGLLKRIFGKKDKEEKQQTTDKSKK